MEVTPELPLPVKPTGANGELTERDAEIALKLRPPGGEQQVDVKFSNGSVVLFNDVTKQTEEEIVEEERLEVARELQARSRSAHLARACAAIDKNTLTEMMSVQTPSARVMRLGQAVCMLLSPTRKLPEWPDFIRLIKSQEDFIRSLNALSSETMSPAQQEMVVKVHDIISDAEMSIANMKKSSRPAGEPNLSSCAVPRSRSIYAESVRVLTVRACTVALLEWLQAVVENLLHA